MQDKIRKYEVIKKLGKELFTQSNVVKTGNVFQEDIEIAKQFLAKAITAVNPEVMASFFEHVMIAPELGRRIAKELEVRGLKFEVNTDEVEFLLWLHEIGRLVDPGGYLRNDVIDERLLTEFGLSRSLIQNLPPVRTFLQVGKMLDLDEKQLRGRKSLNKEQEKIASDYFNLLTPTQRIIFLADNFGKLDNTGKLFNLEAFLNYVRSQDERYQGIRDWALDRMPSGAVLTILIVEKTIEWLEKLGLHLESILTELKDYGPKFVIVARHGELDNPRDILYNRDSVMKPEDIIHLSDYGREQMRILGELMSKRKFRVSSIFHSPSTRAVESKDELDKALGVNSGNIITLDDLDDVYAPGGYISGMKLAEFERLGGNAYDAKLWDKYGHENIASVSDRLQKTFWNMAVSLKVGEAGVIVSHGDPIAIWIQTLTTGQIPLAVNLRKGIYPNKGEAIVAIIDPTGHFFTYYILTDPSLKIGKQY